MADPVSSVKHIAEVALKIKQAVETVRKNKEDCLQIGRRVVRVSDILAQLQETENIMNKPAISSALEELADTLRHAHTLVVACQERNVVCLFCAATTLSKKLRRVNDDISDQLMVGIFATTVHVTIALSQIQGDREHDVMRLSSLDSADLEPTPPKMEEPKPPPFPPEEPTSPLPRKEPPPLPPPEKPELPLVVVHPPSPEEEPTPPLLPQFGGVPVAKKGGFSLHSDLVKGQRWTGTSCYTYENPYILRIADPQIKKGVLRDGLEVAVRKYANGCPSRYDEEPEMQRLIHLCSMLEHKNIVKLLGYCHENRGFDMPNENKPKGIVAAKEELLLLVEEYMANGNLSNFIYGEQLDWSTRFRIIQGITQGIIYLHTHSDKPTIVHLDLKPDNILLDSDMNPKIGDFGLAKVLDDDEIKASVRGTLGYMPPEYIVEGVISVKNDVYGFGVTLLETISGMSESGRDARHQASIEWAWNVRQSGAINKLFDPSMCDESQLKEIKRCIEIGLLCTQNKSTDRPTMSDVLEMLQGKKKVATPKQPGYIKRVRAVGRYKHL